MPDNDNTNIQEIKVRREYSVAYTVSYPEFIDWVDRLSQQHLGQSLDSMDGGDAVGACIRLHDKLQDDTGVWLITRPYGNISVTYQDDSFEWIPHLETDD